MKKKENDSEAEMKEKIGLVKKNHREYAKHLTNIVDCAFRWKEIVRGERR